tara:strand:- start:188 stop:337 length:150 start_codon:yes stop_codon:yes gene_type:complete
MPRAVQAAKLLRRIERQQEASFPTGLLPYESLERKHEDLKLVQSYAERV